MKRALTETERQRLSLAAREPLTHEEDPDAIDSLVAAGLLAEDDTTFLELKIYRLTACGRATLSERSP